MTYPVLFLAAGFGTRMRPLTDDMPKPLIKVGTTTLLDHGIALAQSAGLGPLVANAHYRADQIEAHLSGRPVTLSREEPEILDSGGALKAALPLLGQDPVFTMNSDNIWSGPNPFVQLVQAWDPGAMDVLMLLGTQTRVLGRKGGGDFSRAADGRLTKGGPEVYLGLQLVKTEPFARHKKAIFGMWDIWTAAIKAGRLYGEVYDGQWCDVGHPDNIALAETLLAGTDV